MSDYKHIILLALIMAGVAVAVGATAIGILYWTAIGEQRHRLEETVQSQARLIEAVARFDRRHTLYAGESREATLSQIKEAYENLQPWGLGKTAEFTLAHLENDTIVFIAAHKDFIFTDAKPVAIGSNHAEPMRRALSGLSGSVIGLDYRGSTVLAAHAPLPELGLGIVAKIDMDEIRAPFMRAALAVLGVAVMAVLVGTVLFFKTSEPMIRRIRKSEEQARAQLVELETLYRKAPIGLGLFDSQLRSVRMNEKLAEIAGCSGEDRRHRIAWELLPNLRGTLEPLLRQVMATGRSVRPVETQGEGTPGQNHVWTVEAYPLSNADGSVMAVGAIVQDVSEERRAEQALRESEGRFRTTFENAAVGMAHVGLDGTWLRVNRRLGELLGYSREELLQTTFQRIVHPDDLPAHLDDAETLMMGLGSRRMETRFVHKDGHVVWIALTAAVQCDETGASLYSMPVMEDITQRKQVEEALAEKEKLLSELVETAPSLVVLTDGNGRIRLFNRTCEALTGYRREDVIGKALIDLFVPEDSKPAVMKRFEDLDPAALRAPHENHWMTVSGERRLIEWRCATLPMAGHEQAGILGIGVDVTRQREMEQFARQQQAELAHVFRINTLGEMATTLAHELNQPLAAILSYAQGCIMLVRAAKGGPEELLGYLEKTAQQARRAGQIIHQMRRFVRREEPMEAAPVDINEVIQAMAALMSVEARANTIAFCLDLTPDLPLVAGDRVAIEQVVVNLFHNSVEALRTVSGCDRRITISSRLAAPGAIAIQVRDNGPGVAPDLAEHAFAPFVTSKNKGLGLGLSICRSIVRDHGGDLWLEPVTDSGADFRFTLPAAEVAETPLRAVG